MPATVELEAALLIRAHDPRAVADTIADQTSSAEYSLHPEPPQTIRDRHFDTPDRALGSRLVVLRVRTVGAAHLVTVKGPSERTVQGAVTRFEYEETWSEATLRAMLDALARLGVRLRVPQVAFHHDPDESMARLGLRLVQDRDTDRRPRSVRTASGAAAAELVVDAVRYRLEPGDVRLHAVEVESKSPEGAAVVEAVVDALARDYGPLLRRWPWGKFETGEVIGRLLKEGRLRGLLTSDGVLLPAAGDLVEASLASRDAM